MAKIITPENLNKGNIIFDVINRTIKIIPYGSLNEEEGMTLRCLYSFCKEEWKDDIELCKYPFPFIAINSEHIYFKEGWNFYNLKNQNKYFQK